MSRQSVRGNAGEDHVTGYLIDNGWQIEARNYRVRGGEIDIIARKADILAFVEVKTRKFGSLTEGVESVNKRKQSFIIRTADRYLEDNPSDAGTIRFDVAEVTVTTEDAPRVIGMNYIADAFDAFSLPKSCEQF